MRILMLHNRYQVRGGEDESTDSEVALLRGHGHQVCLLEAHNDAIDGVRQAAAAVLSTTWSRQWAARVDDLLTRTRYDIVHVQNFFPMISPSIYYTAARHGVPVVQSVRNYRLICPSANLFRDGRYCQDCVGRGFAWPAIRHRCYRGSGLGSAAVAAMQSTHRLLGTWRNKVAVYVALTNFVRDKLIQGGLPAERIVVKPNFVMSAPDEPAAPPSARNYVLFVGRLHPDKGVDTLLEAWASLDTPFTLKLVGEGILPAVPSGPAGPTVQHLGRRPLAEVYALMRGARCVVFPPKWQEPFGRVVVEAFAAGTPVIASRVGALPEMITHGVNGLLFEAGNAADLALRVREMLANPGLAEMQGKAAYGIYCKKYSPETNYDMLISIYNEVLNKGSSTRRSAYSEIGRQSC